MCRQLGVHLPGRWTCLVKPGRRARVGATVRVGEAVGVVEAVLEERDGARIIRFDDAPPDLETVGTLPLPPYMDRPLADAADRERYQTVYARAEASRAIAAPTAGLHFTGELLARLPHTFITLHVGTGTFRPVKTADISEHEMHAEKFAISEPAAAEINAAKRIVAVGTTSVRVLESARRIDGELIAQTGSTNIFIHPPQTIRHADVLLTNFHLPRSTLIMLVSAFAGREFILRAYAEAVAARYRFYSYGDCMLIL